MRNIVIGILCIAVVVLGYEQYNLSVSYRNVQTVVVGYAPSWAWAKAQYDRTTLVGAQAEIQRLKDELAKQKDAPQTAVPTPTPKGK